MSLTRFGLKDKPRILNGILFRLISSSVRKPVVEFYGFPKGSAAMSKRFFNASTEKRDCKGASDRWPPGVRIGG